MPLSREFLFLSAGISLLERISEVGGGMSWRALVSRAWSQLSLLRPVLGRAASPALRLSLACHTGRVPFASKGWVENKGILEVCDHKGL